MSKKKGAASSPRKKANKNAANFQRCVDLAAWFLTDQRYDEKGRDLYSSEGGFLSTMDQIEPLFSGPIACGDLDGRNVTTIDLFSEIDVTAPLSYRVLGELLARKVEAGEPLNEAERTKAAGLLRGTIPKPEDEGGAPCKDYLHSRIVWAVTWLCFEGLNGAEAIDAVTTALNTHLKFCIEASTVKDIWYDKRNGILVLEYPEGFSAKNYQTK